jgi:murein DD-endopeptidase MepM/ murein hydrolase activator NlpD
MFLDIKRYAYLQFMNSVLENVLQKNQPNFRSVVDFNAAADKLLLLDFTAANQELSTEMIADTAIFSTYINNKLSTANARYGIGGYGEDRLLYKRSNHFKVSESSKVSPMGGDFEGAASRSIHLGIDIWGAAGTKVFVPIGGTVHSFAYNDNYGDYGAAIILQHQLDTIVFHTLYGHLSLADLSTMQEGKYISRGELLAHFGEPNENGDWPPHLHFQIIEDMRISRGDYPGVCTISEKGKYLKNCPDADLILNMMKYAQ